MKTKTMGEILGLSMNHGRGVEKEKSLEHPSYLEVLFRKKLTERGGPLSTTKMLKDKKRETAHHGEKRLRMKEKQRRMEGLQSQGVIILQETKRKKKVANIGKKSFSYRDKNRY